MSTLPDGATLTRLESLGRLVNAFGVPLLLVLFIVVYFGWLPSPHLAAVQQNHAVLIRLEHDLQIVLATRTTEHQHLVNQLTRLIEIVKTVDCGTILDPKLRERCLTR